MAALNMADALAVKLERVRSGAPLRVLDLFAGCGGLSLGFKAAGFQTIGAVESDPFAAASYSANFHGDDSVHAQPRDITQGGPMDLARALRLLPAETAVDVIVGGPPCQAFARVGRPKLREIADHPEAFRRDPRAQLYLHYLDYVEAFQPLALLIENVPDVLNHGGQNIAEEICDLLNGRDYIARYTLLNAAYYGVPQMRERMFLVAFRKELADQVTFPTPTHRAELPPGYNGTRMVALKFLGPRRLFDQAHSYIEPPEAGDRLPEAVTAEEAIGDLPPITMHLEGRLTRGARRFTDGVPYDRRRRVSAYARSMREWPGYEAPDLIKDHVIRYLPRDWKLFGRMQEGDQYPEAYALATRMFEERLAELRAGGESVARRSAAWKKLRKEYIPPYDVNKFPNKWRRMWRDQPARTLMAHLSKDSYSHIHYDSNQARTISVREAARLQSFPDGFVFRGTMNPAFRQIGNAVPPLMARALATVIRQTLEAAAARPASSEELVRTAAVV